MQVCNFRDYSYVVDLVLRKNLLNLDFNEFNESWTTESRSFLKKIYVLMIYFYFKASIISLS